VTIRAVIIGAAGRMGQALTRVAAEFPDLRLVGAITAAGSPVLGRDLGQYAGIAPLGITLSADLASALRNADVAIDFSRPEASAANLAACRAAGTALLIGTTGLRPLLSESEQSEAARQIALLVAANTSLGVTLLMELVRQAASALPAEFDVEILETHHRMKRDAPSGTALALGQVAATARGTALDEIAADRAGPRRPGAIGFAVSRGGDVVGEHEVRFLGPGEQLVLAHRATDRAVFARGAITAALWLAQQPAGRYEMRDILF
jgi:4-hydroxy-tetrahydrodipicolinate reductase